MDFLDKIFDEFNNNSISGLTDELKGLYIKYLCNKFKKNVIVVTNSLYQATNYYNLINNYFENSYFFPMDDFITTVLTTSSPDLMVKRLETLSLISNNNENKIVVTNLEGFLKFVPKKDNIVNQDIVIKINDNFKRTDLEDKLFQYGYNKTSIVTSTGEYSVRGFIIDLFPYNYDKPIRIEFFGDEIDSIKKFDEESQLSTENISGVTIKPYKENDLESDSTLYDILDNPIVVKIDSDNIKKSYLELQNQILEYKESNNIDINRKYMANLEDIYIKDEYELINLKKESARIKRNLTREINKMRTTKPKIFGKVQTATFSQMGDTMYLNLLARREALEKDTNTLTKEEYERYKKLILKTAKNKEYMKNIFKEN